MHDGQQSGEHHTKIHYRHPGLDGLPGAGGGGGGGDPSRGVHVRQISHPQAEENATCMMPSFLMIATACLDFWISLALERPFLFHMLSAECPILRIAPCIVQPACGRISRSIYRLLARTGLPDNVCSTLLDVAQWTKDAAHSLCIT